MFSILIVDDNLSDREGIRDLIDWESLGVRVAGLAVNGLDGYQKAMELKPDFVLTDVAMPLMDGLKMAEKIKSDLPDVKFIFMSCFDDFNYVKEAMRVEAYDYALKPINLEELTETIRKVRDLTREQQERERTQEERRLLLEESMPVLQAQFLRDLLYGDTDSEPDIQARMQYLGMNYQQGFYTVLFIQVDNYNLIYADTPVEHKYLLVYRIKKHLEEYLLKGRGYVLNQQNNSLAVLLFANAGNQEEALEEILDALNAFKEGVNQQIHVQITIGISEFSRKLSEVRWLYERAEYAVKSKFYGEGNRIILASLVKSLDSSSLEYNFMEIKQEIRHILEQEDAAEVQCFMDKYYNADGQYTEAYIKNLTFTIVNILQSTLVEKNESFKSIFDSETVIWEKLSRFETILDIKQWLSNILESVRAYLNPQDSSRYRKIVEDIKTIIEQHYAEFDNIEQIVKPLYISASHANFIFKQQTGQTIFDYLIQTRMEMAKRMLTDPYMKIYEIAEKVGYKSKSYFGSVFKEYTGMTPKQFADRNTR